MMHGLIILGKLFCLLKPSGSSRVRPLGYKYGSRFRIARAVNQITKPEVMSTAESTNDDKIDSEPER